MLPPALPVRYLLNPRAEPLSGYGHDQRQILNLRAHEVAFRHISSWPGYEPTPLRALPGLAAALGVASLRAKDEGLRLGLGSFKALGGIYGVQRAVLEFLEPRVDLGALPMEDLSRGRMAPHLEDLTVACASAGNHGRAVARGAAMFGCSSVIFLPVSTSRHRVRAIEALGARTVPVAGTFDDAVSEAAEVADRNGWTVVADTTFPGYLDPPRHIMQGYTVLAREALEQVPEGELPTHVFLQAGVGGLAAAVTGHFWEDLGSRRPRVVVVEPSEADGLLEAALLDQPTPSRGSLQTSMECLACRTVSDPAWTILRSGADAFMTISDDTAGEAVELLGKGMEGDPPIPTQPSGAAGLAGVIAAHFEPTLASPLSLGPTSRVLIIVSEGPP